MEPMQLSDNEFLQKFGPLEAWPKVTIDYKGLAVGFYDLIMNGPTEDYQAALAFGMMPAPLMVMFERHLRERLLGDICRAYDMEDTAENRAYFVLPKRQFSEVMHKFTLAVLGVAAERGHLVV